MTFDRVYPETSQQPSVFDDSGVIDLVNRAVAGYSATVFAFGQTGSGKTFTMTGPPGPLKPETQGVIPRALRHLFEVISASPHIKYTVRAAYLEIYNESVQDLLNPTAAALPVRWRRDRGFYVENLFVVECDVLDDCLAVLEEGLRNRTTGAHALNERSSRSHSILTVYIESEEEPTGMNGAATPNGEVDTRIIQKFGKISFVDLAGSERVKESKTTGDALTETGNINRSLLVLGTCISALSDPKRKTGHIPYRDSKLTKLLMDSLGGNGLALMIACISPATQVLTETIQTLRYASRAKRIRNRPSVQLDPREELIVKLKKEVKILREENGQLRAAMQGTPFVNGGPGDPQAIAQMAQTYGVEIDSLKFENVRLTCFPRTTRG
ncbi:P-loop containing nucleoside triphosphate hydrolase protein, partial [Catenaria anguillulae PL171]